MAAAAAILADTITVATRTGTRMGTLMGMITGTRMAQEWEVTTSDFEGLVSPSPHFFTFVGLLRCLVGLFHSYRSYMVVSLRSYK